MLKTATGSVRDAVALLLAIAFCGWIVFGLAWFIAELIVMVLAGACVGYVVSHMRGKLRELTQENKVLAADNVRMKQLVIDAQERGVYATRVVSEEVRPGIIPKMLRRG